MTDQERMIREHRGEPASSHGGGTDSLGQFVYHRGYSDGCIETHTSEGVSIRGDRHQPYRALGAEGPA